MGLEATMSSSLSRKLVLPFLLLTALVVFNARRVHSTSSLNQNSNGSIRVQRRTGVVAVELVEEKLKSYMFVATSARNYAFTCPLLPDKWRSVSFNKQLVVITLAASTLEANFEDLSEWRQDLIFKCRELFIKDLRGLPPSIRTYERSVADSLAANYSKGQSAGYKAQTPLAPRAPQAGYAQTYAKPTLNFYNIFDLKLKDKLRGDVFRFDMCGNILDILSESVSIKFGGEEQVSLLYRNHNFFYFSQPNLPQTIVGFFLLEHVVFFVYKDGSVLSKTSWLLDAVEVELVVKARTLLKATEIRLETLGSGKSGPELEDLESLVESILGSSVEAGESPLRAVDDSSEDLIEKAEVESKLSKLKLAKE